MIVHQPEITCVGYEAVLSARVEFRQAPGDIPGRLWFCYPARYKDNLSDRADAFAAGLLHLAMHQGEDLEVRGPVSQKLLYGLGEYQNAFRCWYPDRFSKVTILPDQVVLGGGSPAGEGVGMAFSGGGDSFYTLWEHLPGNQPLKDYQVTHCLFLHGFDISLLRKKDYDLACESFAAMLSPLGIELLPCRTNLHSFFEGRVRWSDAHGAVLLAAALGLGGLFNKFLIASSVPYEDLVPFGTSVVIDHLLSTESMQVIHHGAALSKPFKMAAMEDWPAVQQNLRLCTDSDRRLGVQNCSRCYKCLRARIILKMMGRLDDFRTFDPHFTLKDWFLWIGKQAEDVALVGEMIRFALAHKKYGYLPLLWVSALASWLKIQARRLMPRWLFFWLRRRLYPVHKNLFLHSTISAKGKNALDDHPSP